MNPRIWVDADACPAPIRDILLRAAERAKLELTLVANRALRKPPSRYVKMLVVPPGFDVADNRIVELARPGDLVITADIPLAAAVVARGAAALNPRGELYTEENVRERLGMRDMLDELRGAGVRTGGPPALGPQDRAAFANQLDRWLVRALRAGTGPAPA